MSPKWRASIFDISVAVSAPQVGDLWSVPSSAAVQRITVQRISAEREKATQNVHGWRCEARKGVEGLARGLAAGHLQLVARSAKRASTEAGAAVALRDPNPDPMT